MPVNIVRGGRIGDEGKGKIVDLAVNTNLLFPDDNPIVANFRVTGGGNAGHTIVDDHGVEHKYHLLPSTSLSPHVHSVIGNHAFVDSLRFHSEIHKASQQGIEITPQSLSLSGLAILTLPDYVLRDRIREAGDDKRGSTAVGIAQTAAAWMLHNEITVGEAIGMRERDLAQIAYDGLAQLNYLIKMGTQGKNSKRFTLGDKQIQATAKAWAKATRQLKPYTIDATSQVNQYLDNGQNILLEGAQGHGLDQTYGKRPYNSSSLTTVAGMLHAAGISRFDQIGRSFLIFKLVESKVGGGVFLTQETNEARAKNMRGIKGMPGAEFGTTTGRPRDVGAVDLPGLSAALLRGGGNELVLNKADCASECGDTVKICDAYIKRGTKQTTKIAPVTNRELSKYRPHYIEMPGWSDVKGLSDYDLLPDACKQYISYIEDFTERQITVIGTGPGRREVIVRK